MTPAEDVQLFVVADLSPYIEAVNEFITAFAALSAGFHIRPDGTVRLVDRHHPRPLPINGAEYHRRRRNR